MKVIYEHQSHPTGTAVIVKEYIQDYFTSPYHYHDLYELIYIAKSYGKIYAGNRIMNFHDGDVFLLGPGLGHCFYNELAFVASGEKAHAIVIFFNISFLQTELTDNPDYFKMKELLDRSLFGLQIKDTENSIINEFNQITHKTGIEKMITLLTILHKITGKHSKEIITLNHSTTSAKLSNRDFDRLEPVINYVLENFRDNLDSKVAASLANMNDAAFCRFFKRRTEKTFSQFTNEVRVTHAKNLLLECQWDILRICYESGFKNLSYFNRQFKLIAGSSPKEFRELFQDKQGLLIRENKPD